LKSSGEKMAKREMKEATVSSILGAVAANAAGASAIEGPTPELRLRLLHPCPLR
jgi:hypothetical protein